MSEKESSEQPPQPAQAAASPISSMFGPTRLLPGESAEVYRAGLIATIKDLGATTHLQTYLAEKIFQCLWWMRRYEVQKRAAIIDAMSDLLQGYAKDPNQTYEISSLLLGDQWDEPLLKKRMKAFGYTAESLLARALSNRSEEVQKLDQQIALRVKTLGQLQQSYEALVNRSVLRERLQLQNELLKRDLQGIDVKAVQLEDGSDGKSNDKSKAAGS